MTRAAPSRSVRTTVSTARKPSAQEIDSVRCRGSRTMEVVIRKMGSSQGVWPECGNATGGDQAW